MPETKLKRYDLPPVTQAGEAVNLTVELDSDTERVSGVLLVSELEDHLYHRGTFGMQLSGSEVFADETHARLMMCGLGVEPQKRSYPLDLPGGNGIVRLSYRDSDSPALVFGGAYVVSVYLKTEVDCG